MSDTFFKDWHILVTLINTECQKVENMINIF